VKFGIWNIKSLYRASSLTTVGSKLAKYNLDLVAIQETRWDKVGSQPADDYTFFFENWNDNSLHRDRFFHTYGNNTSS